MDIRFKLMFLVLVTSVILAAEGNDTGNQISKGWYKAKFKVEEVWRQAKVKSSKCKFFSPNSCIIHGLYWTLFAKLIPKPIQHLFDKRETTNQKNSNEETDKKEHGRLDFFGRDVIRGIQKQIKKIGEKISPSGLDTNKTFFSGVPEKFKEKLQAIVPGTKWCGDGDKAESHDDLGRFAETDKCCRNHDKCPDNIPAGATQHGLTNTGLFTRSRCDCDINFYNCLKNVGNIISKKIGFTYFTVLGPQCYQKHFECEEEGSDCGGRTGKSMVEKYKWFDNPKF